MNRKNILAGLLFMDESSAEAIINAAFVEYTQLISDIYNDIYTSCIQLYYDQYTPIKYDRHGDIGGFNLYGASDIYARELRVNLSLEASKLLPYKGKKDKRLAVLSTVLNGLRGAGSSKTPPGWPMDWDAYYPNEFSELSEWSSSNTTLYNILQDFAKNGPRNLSYKFYEFIENRI